MRIGENSEKKQNPEENTPLTRDFVSLKPLLSIQQSNEVPLEIPSFQNAPMPAHNVYNARVIRRRWAVLFENKYNFYTLSLFVLLPIAMTGGWLMAPQFTRYFGLNWPRMVEAVGNWGYSLSSQAEGYRFLNSLNIYPLNNICGESWYAGEIYSPWGNSFQDILRDNSSWDNGQFGYALANFSMMFVGIFLALLIFFLPHQ